MSLEAITDQLCKAVHSLTFDKPVTHVYNPLDYAREPYDNYLRRYGKHQPEILLLGMNPGPFGMAQTGVPFGEIEAVREWLNIQGGVNQPDIMHPKRPVEGFNCTRSEVSGRRIWSWAKNRYQSPDAFFQRFFILNYCPLVFIEESGRNRTPDKLPVHERNPLFEVCDEALRQTVRFFNPRLLIGVGAFAQKRAEAALKGTDIAIQRITHPSPANPKANRGWESCIEQELAAMGIELP